MEETNYSTISLQEADGKGGFNAYSGVLPSGRMQTRRRKFVISFHIVQLILGLAEILVASLWSHVVGILIGSLTVVSAVFGIAVWLGKIQLDFNHSGFKGRCAGCAMGLLHGVLFVMTLAMFLVHVSTHDPEWTAFTARCRGSNPQNCIRVTYDSPYDTHGLEPISLKHSIWRVREAIENELDDDRANSILRSTIDGPQDDIGYIHARSISTFWGFPDDLQIGVHCNETIGEARVQFQSQSRLGVSDFGANYERVKKLTEFVQNDLMLPIESCS